MKNPRFRSESEASSSGPENREEVAAMEGVELEMPAANLGEFQGACLLPSSPIEHAADPALGSPTQPAEHSFAGSLFGLPVISLQGAGHISGEPHFLISRRLPLCAAGQREGLEREESPALSPGAHSAGWHQQLLHPCTITQASAKH